MAQANSRAVLRKQYRGGLSPALEREGLMHSYKLNFHITDTRQSWSNPG